MDQDVVILANEISKQYRLGTINHGLLWQDLKSWWARRQGREDPNSKVGAEPGHLRTTANAPFFALDDVSFSVRRGETLGIIGRNGAGKSTLLKVLSRITLPSKGTVQIRGRVASLLEVGTGFHPELTGRENVFLNGSILGMTKTEIRSKFDEIVAFAEIEDFIDTPVKRYSSGMYVRLAFSVAAHLDPEILIVDEVLAVGDSKFQRKCLGKMEDVTHGGRTVLFVSHNMGAVTSLCNRCIVLQKGKLVYEGSTGTAVIQYHTSGVFTTAALDPEATGAMIGDEQVQLVRAAVHHRDGDVSAEYENDQPITVSMRYRVLRETPDICVPNFHFLMPDGSYAFCAVPSGLKPAPPGEYLAECHLPAGLLNEGTYFVGVAVTTYGSMTHHSNFWEQGALCFNVREDIEKTAGYRYGYTGAIPGSVRPTLDWDVRRVE